MRPLTLILAAACLWALSVLILALAGLGSRFAAPVATQAPPRLPVVSLTRSQSRLGPVESYAEVGVRPLMNENRQPMIQVAVAGNNASQELDVVLTSVLITPRLQMAILTGNKDTTARRVRVGDTMEGSNWRLVSVQPRSATLEGPGGQRVLELRVFNGRGGELPTPTVAAVPAPPGAPPPATPAVMTPPPAADAAQPAASVAGQQAEAQQQQIEAIRRRIEARRAQMRAEAGSSSAPEK